MPSFILIRPTVWPQYTDRQTGQTDRQRTDNIGRTVLQAVPPKTRKIYSNIVVPLSQNIYIRTEITESKFYLNLHFFDFIFKVGRPTSVVLQSCCVVVVELLCCGCEVVVLWLWSCCVVVVKLLCCGCEVVVLWLNCVRGGRCVPPYVCISLGLFTVQWPGARGRCI